MDEYFEARARQFGAFDGFRYDSLSDFQLRRVRETLGVARSHISDYVRQGRLVIDPACFCADVYASPRLSAFADAAKENYYVGVSLALLVVLDRTWNALLSVSSSFSGVGDPTREKSVVELPTLPLYASQSSTSLSTLLDAVNAAEPGDAPRCPVRRRFAAEMSSVSLVYCVLHEAAHVLWGHTRFKGAQQGVCCIDEFPTPGQTAEEEAPVVIPEERTAVSQAMELLADTYAFEILLDKWRRAQITGSPLRTAWWGDVSGSPLDAPLAVTSAASSAFFLLLIASGQVGTATHPHPFYRMSWCSLAESRRSTRSDGMPYPDRLAFEVSMLVWEAFRAIGLGTMLSPSSERCMHDLKILERNALIVSGLCEPHCWDRLYRATSEGDAGRT